MAKRKYKKRTLTKLLSRKQLSAMTSKRELKKLEERINTLKLRIQGKTYQEIQKELKISSATVQSNLKHSLTTLHDLECSNAQILRNLELTRLDDLQQGIWDEAKTGNLQALDRVLKIIETRAKLTGLLQAITNNTINIQNIEKQNNLTIEQITEKRKGLEDKLSYLKTLTTNEGE